MRSFATSNLKLPGANSRFARRVAVLAGGTAAGQLVVALSSPLVTRLYAPEDLGLLAVFVSILSPLISLASLRYEVAVVLPEKNTTALHLMFLSFGLVAASGGLVLVTTLTLGHHLAALFNADELGPYLWLLAVSVVGGGLFQTLSFWAVRIQAFSTIGQARLTQSVMMVAVQLALGLASLAPLGLFLGDIAGRSAGSGRLLRQLRASARTIHRPSASDLRAVAARYKRFPMFSLGPAVLNSVGLQLPAMLLASQYGPTPVGLFALGQRILGAPLGLVSNAVGQVFLGDTAVVARSAPDRLMGRFVKAARMLLLIGAVVVIPVALVAPWAFAIVFGERWGDAGRYVQLLAPLLICQFASNPMGSMLDVLERQDLHLVREIVRIVLLLVGFAASRVVGGGPQTLVGSLSLAGATGYAVGLALVWIAIRQATSTSPPPTAGDQ